MPRTVGSFQDVVLDREFDALWQALDAVRAAAGLSANAGSETGSGTGGATGGSTGVGDTGTGGTETDGGRTVGDVGTVALKAWLADMSPWSQLVHVGTVATAYGDYTVEGDLVVDGILHVVSEPVGASVNGGSRIAEPMTP
jgi:hypothetical protein